MSTFGSLAIRSVTSGDGGPPTPTETPFATLGRRVVVVVLLLLLLLGVIGIGM